MKGGGPTVKNVTGYDLPRLFVGSLGTLGVIVQVTLRSQPRPRAPAGARATAAAATLRAQLFRPACLAWDGRRTPVLLEGHPDDVAAEQAAAGLQPIAPPPPWPDRTAPGPRSRAGRRARRAGGALDDLECAWLAEGGVGTVHIARGRPKRRSARRRAAAEADGGGCSGRPAPGLDPFGVPLANLARA